MKKERGYLTKNLFGEELPKRGEKGYLEPGFRFDKDGNIVDDKGNIYDEEYNLIKEASSEEWKKAMEMARRSDPNRSDDDLKPLAEYYYHRIMTRKQKEEKLKRKKGRSK